MIPMPVGTQIWVACGATDMRNYAERIIMLSPRRSPEYPRYSSVG
jgi:hypothetical protein